MITRQPRGFANPHAGVHPVTSVQTLIGLGLVALGYPGTARIADGVVVPHRIKALADVRGSS
jgi:hypothetical protein